MIGVARRKITIPGACVWPCHCNLVRHARPDLVDRPVTGGALLLAPAARAQDTTPTLSASDFTLTLDTGSIVLTSEQLATYFSRARCACPTTLTATLTLSSDAAAKIDVSTLDAQLMIGSDCDNAAATGCPTIGGTLLFTNSVSPTVTLRSADIFSNAAGGSCTSTTSTRLWAMVRRKQRATAE